MLRGSDATAKLCPLFAILVIIIYVELRTSFVSRAIAPSAIDCQQATALLLLGNQSNSAVTCECPQSTDVRAPLQPSRQLSQPPSEPEVSFLQDGNILCNGSPDCPFHSQSGEDRQMVALLRKFYVSNRNLRFPTGPGHAVLEIGGLDGVKFSNSFFFENFLGWRAVLFEPDRNSYADLSKNRPRATNLQLAICEQESVVTFVSGSDNAVSGVEKSMSEAFKRLWHKDENERRYNVSCGPLSKYLPLVGLNRAEIFFLDVEGGELLTLQGVNFETTSFHYIVIEMDGSDPPREDKIRELLKRQGYNLVQKMGEDRNELFENINWM